MRHAGSDLKGSVGACLMSTIQRFYLLFSCCLMSDFYQGSICCFLVVWCLIFTKVPFVFLLSDIYITKVLFVVFLLSDVWFLPKFHLLFFVVVSSRDFAAAGC